MLKRVADIDLPAIVRDRPYPSPAAWEDEVLYFLMLDRFSDGNETGYRGNDGQIVAAGTTPPFRASDRGNATRTPADRQRWFDAGQRFVGGTLKGLTGKIGYLRRLGVTAIWVSPIFRQLPSQQSYHGYGIQNFLDVDPRFGSREDLVALVDVAHRAGIRVILDIILNHAGDVFDYDPDDARCPVDPADPGRGRYHCWQGDGHEYRVAGFRDAAGSPGLPLGPLPDSAFPDSGVWPAELQAPEAFSRRGRIRNWDYDPEFREGDFETLKDIRLGQGSMDDYRPSPALLALTACYKYWIALADIDGFRVDTVKHMDDGASRFFTSAIHEFCESIGKENFYLIGEVTGGRERAFSTLESTGMNAALGINDIPDKIEYLVKGFRNPEDYFNLFRNSLLVNKQSHVWFRDVVVTTFDDHDQVRKGRNRARFAHAESEAQQGCDKQLLNVLALTATTMGIPCIYYGTEQGFDGHGDNDRYLREAMFGGEFGAFESRDRHFFNEETPVYRELAKILAIRRDNVVIRRGRQYLRQISGNGIDFGLPRMLGGEIRSIVAWSRIFAEREVLLAINTDSFADRTAWVTIEANLHAEGGTLECLYSSDASRADARVGVEGRNGLAVRLTVPAAGFVIYA